MMYLLAEEWALIAVGLLSPYTFSRVVAIEVSASSPCGALCIDSPSGNVSELFSSSTQTSMVVCNDTSLIGQNSTATGRKWRSCMECLEKSAYVDPIFGENDLYWFLFNMKFSFDWCTLGFTDQVNPEVDPSQTACLSSCQAIGPLTTFQLLNTDMGLQYAYCNNNGLNYSEQYITCRDCLSNVSTAQTLSQYTEALNVACETTPSNGSSLPLKLDVFSTTQVSSSTVSSSTIPTATPSPISSQTSTPTPSSGLSTGAKAGIGVGVAGVVIIAALSGIWILTRRRRASQPEFEKRNDEYCAPVEISSYSAAVGTPTKHEPIEIGDSPAEMGLGLAYRDLPRSELA